MWYDIPEKIFYFVLVLRATLDSMVDVMTTTELIRLLRLAHARHMASFDRHAKAGNKAEAQYWLWRASETHQKLLDLGAVAI